MQPVVGLEARVAHPGVGRTECAHFVPDFLGIRLAPVVSHPAREVEEDADVVPGPGGRVQGLAHALDPALAVGHRPLGFAPAGRGREDHVGHLGGRGEEDVLDDEEVEALEPMPGLGLVGLRLERVLAEDVEGPELAPFHRLEHLREVPAALAAGA